MSACEEEACPGVMPVLTGVRELVGIKPQFFRPAMGFPCTCIRGANKYVNPVLPVII